VFGAVSEFSSTRFGRRAPRCPEAALPGSAPNKAEESEMSLLAAVAFVRMPYPSWTASIETPPVEPFDRK
jgi:hypothetical protein